MPFPPKTGTNLRHPQPLPIAERLEWLQERQGVEEISLNRRNSEAPLGLCWARASQEKNRGAIASSEFTVALQRMSLVEAPKRMKQPRRDALQRVVSRESGALVRAFVAMEDGQTIFQLLRLSAVSHISHVLRTVSPSITRQAVADHDTSVKWAWV